MDESYQLLFLKTKEYYFSIRKVRCPLLNNEWVYFSRKGFEHLIRKRRFLRPISDQIRRFYLLKYAKQVIESTKIYEYKNIKSFVKVRRNKQKVKEINIIQFWTLSHHIHGHVIKVVIIQEGNGRKHFLSIMSGRK